MKEPSIDILLAAYNGEKYIRPQIQSVLDQTHKNIRLIIRDDFSQDSTRDIIGEYAQSHPGKVVIIPSEKREGAKGNFSILMRHAESPYVMFCDQDDIWMEEKVSKALSLMQKMEAQYGPSCPCLVHTDLKVVDQDLNPISDSFWKYANLTPERGAAFSRILMQNIVTGCTAMINRSLLHLVEGIPSEALMHDWWIALVAGAFGRIDNLPQATVLYRQHAKNTLGAQKFGTTAHIKKAWKTLREEGWTVQKQAKAFFDLYQREMDKTQQEILKAFLSLSTCNWLEGRAQILRYRLFKNGWMRNLACFFLQSFSKEPRR